MLFRAFSKLAEVQGLACKYKLPGLTKTDPLEEEKDVKAMFDRLLTSALPNKRKPDRPILPRSGLNKLALLYKKFRSKNKEDCDVLLSAYWTYCGHKYWPSNGSAQIIAQTCINLEAPEKAIDFFLYNKHLRFYPNVGLLNRYLKSLLDKGDFNMVLEIFKKIYSNQHIRKNDLTYLIVFQACKSLKKWKWVFKFQKTMPGGFSQDFYDAVNEISQDLTEEERTKFLFGLKND